MKSNYGISQPSPLFLPAVRRVRSLISVFLYFLYYNSTADFYSMQKVNILIFKKGVIIAYQLDCAAIHQYNDYKDYITGKRDIDSC